MTYWSKLIIDFYQHLKINRNTLPKGIEVMNPYADDNSKHVMDLVKQFYGQYYQDTQERHLIIGINPGRHGAGVTGIPFTDTKRLEEYCGISTPHLHTHEPSSVYVYELIAAMGGPLEFYKKFHITSFSPLGFLMSGKNGKMVNFNFYDDQQFMLRLENQMKKWMEEQLQWPINRKVAFVWGTGKNEKFANYFNEKYSFFEKIVALEHPRFVAQYRWKRKDEFIDKFISTYQQFR